MLRSLATRSVTRRSMLMLAAGLAAAPVLAACGQAAPPTNTPAPAKPAEAPKPAAAEPTKPAAAAPTTAPAAAATKPAAAPATAPTQAPAAAAPAAAKPSSSVKINGNLQIIQSRSFNPVQTTFQHNLLLREAASRNWPLDKTYIEGFTAGTNIYEKLQAQAAAGDAPDLIVGGIDTFQLWNLGLVEAVDDVIQWATSQFGKTSPPSDLNLKIEGKWYAVPYAHYSGAFWVRKSWFDAAGIDITKPYDFNQWREHALKVTDPDKKRWGWGNTVNRSGDGNTNVRAHITKAGSRITTADNKVAFNSPETIAGYEWLKETYSDPKWARMLPPGINAWTDPSNNEAWLAGTIGFSSNAGTMIATSAVQAKDVYADAAAVPEPTGPVGKKGSEILIFPSVQTLQLFKGGKNRDAAKEMIEVLLSKENQDATIKTNPALVLPGFQGYGWEHPTLKEPPNKIMDIQKELLFNPNVFNRFLPGDRPRLWINATDTENVETDVMADILKGTPVAQAVANGHKRMEEIHAKFQGK
jgi:multiple sugar transport system substrate-binding protein